MLFCGIDLHSNNCLVVVSDDNDKVVYSKRLSNDLATICAALSPYRQELFGVVVESTYNWYWLVDGLVAAGHSLHLANTTAIKQYDGLKHRGDESDARHLAHVLRLGLLPEGHTSCLKPIVRSETLRAGACNWLGNGHLRSFLSRRVWHSTWAPQFLAIASRS